MARKSKNLPVRNHFLILTNGKRSEKNYFEALRGKFRSIYEITVKFMNDAPEALVNHAIAEKKKTNRVFCVFDKDEFPNDSVYRAMRAAKENGIGIAFSNMSFEVWLIDHFHQCKDEKNNYQLISELDELLRANGHSQGYAKGDQGVIINMLIPRLDDAVHNADVVSQKYIRELKESGYTNDYLPVWRWNSYTDVHKLIVALKLEQR